MQDLTSALTRTLPYNSSRAHHSDDINRIKRIFKKHWILIKNNTLLNHIFPSPPVIAYKANPSLRKKLVRARLKPLDQTNPNPMPDPNMHEESQQSNPIIPSTYLNTPLKTIEIQSKDVTKNVTTVRKWKPNPLPTAQQKQPEPQ